MHRVGRKHASALKCLLSGSGGDRQLMAKLAGLISLLSQIHLLNLGHRALRLACWL
jgi:hypothetical protein